MYELKWLLTRLVTFLSLDNLVRICFFSHVAQNRRQPTLDVFPLIETLGSVMWSPDKAWCTRQYTRQQIVFLTIHCVVTSVFLMSKQSDITLTFHSETTILETIWCAIWLHQTVLLSITYVRGCIEKAMAAIHVSKFFHSTFFVFSSIFQALTTSLLTTRNVTSVRHPSLPHPWLTGPLQLATAPSCSAPSGDSQKYSNISLYLHSISTSTAPIASSCLSQDNSCVLLNFSSVYSH